VIQGNFIGIREDGTTALGNSLAGVALVGGATANTVGGTTPASRNIISANNDGVFLVGAGTSNNVIQGNFIGTDATGTAALGNARDGVLFEQGASANTLGGTATGATNVISGSGLYGVYLYGSGTSGNVVLGNKIGTDVNGMAPLGNTSGVVLALGPTANTVGGATAGANNLISGNINNGVELDGVGTSANVVQGNFIGTDVNGTAAVPNGLVGVLVRTGATANTVGGVVAGAGNLISGNAADGVYLTGSGTSGNVVLGNLIGTDVTGTAALGNAQDGVHVSAGAAQNAIGGTAAGATNVISANGDSGVEIDGAGTSGNVVLGNLVGTDASGTAALGNSRGVVIGGGATRNTGGGTAAGSRNVISANQAMGVSIDDSGTSGNAVLGNFIGTDATGTAALGNTNQGVLLQLRATANTVGGTASGAANVISGNTDGVYLKTPGTSGNVVLGNLIGTDKTGTAKLGNTDDGVHFGSQVSGNTIGGTAAGSGNVISGNGRDGVYIRDNSSGNVVLGNRIGTDRNGTAKLGNALAGVGINQARQNTIGGTVAGAANLISGNGAYGVYLYGDRASGNVVLGNRIGTDASGTGRLGNGQDGVLFEQGATGNTLGGTAAGAANVVSGNGRDGVYLKDTGTSGNVVLGNKIGTDVSGTAKLGNTQDGVLISNGATGNTVGGTASGAANAISGNGSNGVEFSQAGTSGNVVLGNKIGTDLGANANLGNALDGILADSGATGNTVGGTVSGSGNTIAWNAKGVVITGDTTGGIAVLGNSIFANAGPGIDLGDDGTTPNGANPRAFPNRGQNAPVLTGVSGNTVSGRLTSKAGTTYRIEIYASPAGGPASKGKTFVGFKTVTTNAAGVVNFTVALGAVPAGWLLTATATNLATGDTSEFSSLIPSLALLTQPSLPPSHTARVVTLSALVHFGSAPVTKGQVRFTIAGLPRSLLGTVNAQGIASVNFLIPGGLPAGSYAITVTYLGADTYLGASGGGVLTVSRWSGRQV
jgi:titin